MPHHAYCMNLAVSKEKPNGLVVKFTVPFALHLSQFPFLLKQLYQCPGQIIMAHLKQNINM